MTGNNSSLTTSGGSFYIGYGGRGSLLITGGGAVTTAISGASSNAAIGWRPAGYQSGLNSIATVTGEGSRWDINNRLYVGYNSDSELLIAGGGRVNSVGADIGYSSATSVSLATITGQNSVWNSDGISRIGTVANGTLIIDDSATMNVTTGYATIGNNSGSIGAVNVQNGSHWNINAGHIITGLSGNGVLNILSGSTVNSQGGIIGSTGAGAQGVVNVSGTNSFWNNDAYNLTIGSQDNATGFLNISQGGAVKANVVSLALGADTTGVLTIGAQAEESALAAGTLDANSVVFGDGDGSIVFNHTDSNYQFNPAISGSGLVEVYSGTTVFNGQNSYSGITSILGGELRAGAENTLSAASDHIIHSGALLDLAGHSQNIQSLDNSGILNIGGNGGTVLTISGDYIGNNGLLNFNSVLADDTAISDKLLIGGNTSGMTHVAINNLGGTGAKTLNGIELISVAGNSDGEFVQNGRIVAGAYDYQLVRGADANANNWYLTSTGKEPAPTLEPDPEVTTPSSPSNVRPEFGGYIANLAAANTMFVTRLHDRLGETQYIDALTGEQKVTSMWLRTAGGHNRSRDNSGQLKIQSNGYVMQIGGDIAQWSNNDLDRLHLGIMAGYGNSHSNTDSRLSGNSSEAQVDGYNLGLYGTWYANEQNKTGVYIDIWAQYGWFDNTIKGDFIADENYKSSGVTASVESGYTFKLGENAAKNTTYFIQPKAQVIWMGVKADDHKEANGTNVSGEGDGNIQTRLGVRAFMNGYSDQDKGKDRVFQPFIEANWIHNTQEFGTKMDGITVKQDGAANIGELKMGVEGQINKKLNLWGNVGQQVGDKGYSDTAVMFGAKYNF
ncbi:autotransporter outer membrane beta-barrel domain-containing protein [Budvicia aquatica]|uniref:autotransporter outer membrane beta-barrel domain-containing protein n=1 Tax=Budvicia aquatica TaxID=82979 RepID=UPI002084D02D|nr:autotransporter outer membrane beta-barrel domain-containing protein [Budvicia aquatica]GKX53865.1 hypothetical protein SOASR029_41740 [Budvicia aquatica]